jgi:quercetin dioxygenase-like cupin family protein
MGYDTATYTEVDPKAPGMYFLRDALDCTELGVTVVEGDADWDGMEHDHADAGHEEVYLLVEGDATLEVDGETVSLAAGDAVRVDPGSTRSLGFEDESLLVVAGAP